MGDLWAMALTEWWHPKELVGIALLLELYLIVIGPLRRRYYPAYRIDGRKVLWFLLGLLALFLAIASPLGPYSSVLFSAHMIQHMLLVLVVAPLLLMGIPDWLLSPMLRYALLIPLLHQARMPTRHLRALARQAPLLRLTQILTHPVTAFFVFTAVFSLWHIPIFYQAALDNELVHIVEHSSLLVSSLMVWWPILSPLGEAPRLSYSGQILYLFLLSISTTPLFGILTFSDGVLYPQYALASTIWNIDPIADQQLGGLLMKIPLTVLFLIILTAVFFRWFNQDEAEAMKLTAIPPPHKINTL